MRRSTCLAVLFLLLVVAPTGHSAAADSGVRAPLWVQTYDGPEHAVDAARDIAVDPASGNVFVAGISDSVDFNGDFALLSYDADGTQRWTRRIHVGTLTGDAAARAVVVDSARGVVYATGYAGASGEQNVLTVAYRLDGTLLWKATFDSPENWQDRGERLTLDPVSGTIYVLGTSQEPMAGQDLLTLAYDVQGNELWSSRSNARNVEVSNPGAITVDPGRGHLYVGGAVKPAQGSWAWLTLAYSSTTGAEIWSSRTPSIQGLGAHITDAAVDLETGNLYVTGALPVLHRIQFTMLTYTSTGLLVGQHVLTNPMITDGAAAAVVVDQDTGRAYATGYVVAEGLPRMATVAFDRTGSQLWAQTLPAGDVGSIGVDTELDADGNVVVAGKAAVNRASAFQVTVYDRSGQRLSATAYRPEDSQDNNPVALAVDPVRGRAYETGQTGFTDMLTIAVQLP